MLSLDMFTEFFFLCFHIGFDIYICQSQLLAENFCCCNYVKYALLNCSVIATVLYN